MPGQAQFPRVVLVAIVVCWCAAGKAHRSFAAEGSSQEAEKVGIRASRPERRLLSVGPQPFDVLHYRPDKSLAMTSELLQAISSMSGVTKSSRNSIHLHAVEQRLDSVRTDRELRNVRLEPHREALLVSPGRSRDAGDTTHINVASRRLPGENRPASRLRCYSAPSSAPGNPEILGSTMSEPSEARFWLPCYDEPRGRATAGINAAVPTGYAAASDRGRGGHDYRLQFGDISMTKRIVLLR